MRETGDGWEVVERQRTTGGKEREEGVFARGGVCYDLARGRSPVQGGQLHTGELCVVFFFTENVFIFGERGRDDRANAVHLETDRRGEFRSVPLRLFFSVLMWMHGMVVWC